MTQSVALLPRLFAEAGNSLKATATGFKTGHEPVHTSNSGTCVTIDSQKETWYCFSCNQGGDVVAAAMSLRGLSREEARAYLSNTFGEDGAGADPRQRESQADLLVRLAKEFTFFHDEFREPYSVVPVNGHQEIWRCRSKPFKQYLRHRFFQAHDKAPSSEAVQSAVGVLEGWGIFDRPMYPLNNRVAWYEGAIWYDLSDPAWRAVKITADGWTIVDTAPILFRRYAHQAPQVTPVRGGALAALDRYMNVSDPARVLLKVTLCSYFIPDIPHAGVHVHGHKGAGKSFLLRTLRQLVDPSQIPLLSVPRDTAELAQQLSHHYAPFYDNLSNLPKWVSDALCRAVTGDGFSKRELYSDDDDVIYRFRRCIGLNGINIAAVEPDILDRLVLIEMSRIVDDEREEDLVLQECFEQDRPAILGAIFDTLSAALKRYPFVTIKAPPRMADYARWGEAISQAMGVHAGEFVALYKSNIQGQHEEVVRSHAVAAAVADLMDERDKWEGSATELLTDLCSVAERLKLDTKARSWPKAPNALTRRLKEVQSDLSEVGITIHFGEDEKRRSKLRIEKGAKKPPEPPEPPKPSKSADLAPEVAPEVFSGQNNISEASPEVLQEQKNTSDISPEKTLNDYNNLEVSKVSEVFPVPLRAGHTTTETEGIDLYEAEERRAIQDENGACPVEIGLTQDATAFEYITTPARVAAIMPELLAAPVIGLDTETTGLDPLKDHLRLIQIATPAQTVVIDACICPVTSLAAVFSSPRRIVGHNLKFDLQFLITAGLPWPTGELFDTMLAAQLLGAGSDAGQLRNCGLAAVTERVLGIPLDKTEQARAWAGTLRHEQLLYAAKDAAVLLPLAEHLQDALANANLLQVAAIEYRCLAALTWMELAGMPLDDTAWLERAAEETHRAQALEGQMYTLLGRSHSNGKVLHLSNEATVNWNSPDQVMEVFRARGYTLDNTNSQSLTALLGTDPLAEVLLEYREAKKRAGTYGKSWLTKHLHSVTGRIHADYFQLGAASGRMSCTKPNVQNLPRNGAYRRAVCPGEERAIVKADFSQIELRIAAVMAKEQHMLSAFRAGEDLHRLTAAKVLNLPLDQVGKEHRQLAKALNFGLLYGMGARSLQEYAATNYKVPLTEAQAKAHRQRFFHAYPGLARWHAQTGAYLEEVAEMETRTLANRRRGGVSSFTVALNSPVQGTGADGLKLALARLFAHRSEASEARLIACVHDEIVAECPEAAAEQTAAWLQRHMIAAMTEIIGDAVPVEVETTIGRDWAGTALNTHHEEERSNV